MNRWFSVVLMMIMINAAGAAFAQEVVIVQGLSLRTDNAVDPPMSRTIDFGVGAGYTDSVDFDKGEGIFFAFPPSFHAAFKVIDPLGDPELGYIDIRRIPDSVLNGGANFFSLTYTMRINPGAGKAIITTPQPLARGIDSINLQSTQPGANVNHTFTSTGGAVTLRSNLINELMMTVYYNYNRAASVPVATGAQIQELSVYPNPVSPGMAISLLSDAPAGSRLVVIDMLGQVVSKERITEAGGVTHLSLPEVPPGVYGLRILGSGGALLGQGHVVVR